MEVLKSILRIALGKKAASIKIQEGVSPEMLVGVTKETISEVPALDQGQIRQLFDFLLPGSKAEIAQGSHARGVLNVPSVGKLQIIAQAAPPLAVSIYVPPAGDQLAEADWKRINNSTVQASPSPIPPAKPADIPGAIPAINTNHPPGPVEGGAPIDFSAHDVPPPTTPNGLPPVSAGGFVPNLAGEDAAPQIAAPPPMPSAPPSPAPAAFPEADHGFGGMDMGQMAVQFPGSGGSGHEGHAGNTPRGPAQIEFGADPSDESVSQGQNSIDVVLKDMIARGASDLHMTNGQNIILRIDGEIIRLEGSPLDEMSMRDFLWPITPESNKYDLADTNDTDFAYEIDGVGRFRVNMFRDRNGIGCVMRHIPSEILTADQLDLAPAIRRLCTLHKGLVLVTGPTGSGKSTTLAAMVDSINKTRREHILTIEDPIEFVHPQLECLINQREIHKHTKGFDVALRAALREDPDIVLIGELRDLETVAIAIETAETGHLVFGTLHTTTAISTIDRIIDQFPSDQQEQIRVMLSSSLKGVVSQTLLKKNGGGRVAAHEILIVNDAVGSMIREGKTHMMASHMQTQKKEGNQLLNEALVNLVKAKIVDPSHALLKAVDKVALLELYKRHGIQIQTAA